ncbi:hypothetical protein P8452_44893 [Trifolium repens]|nr:hypothetical protein P8452_44893 [Trifolium repens]
MLSPKCTELEVEIKTLIKVEPHEVALMKWLGHRWRVHWAISGPFTVAFVVATAAWLFFPPLLRDGADRRSIEELNSVVHCVMRKFQGRE